MALTVETAVQAIIQQADTLAGTSTAEELVYLAKTLESVSDSTQRADDAVQAIIDRANAVSGESSAEDLIYLAKAVEALATNTTIADITNEGTTQVARVRDVTDQQVARVGATQFENELRSSAIEYDTAGRVSKVTETLTDNSSRVTVFSYDEFERLSSATKTFAGQTWVETYEYDAAGNLTETTIAEEVAQ